MIVFLVAFAVTILGMAALLPILHRRVLDIPNERSSHDVPIPRGGGLMVIGGVLLATVVAAATGHAVAWPLLVIMVVIAGVGFVDDVRGLGGGVRLALQVLAAIAVTVWCLYRFDGNVVPTLLFATLSVIAITGYVNAFNFMDGINGISAVSAVVAGGWFAWLGHRQEMDSLVVGGLALAGASLGFLPWNAPRARVFLGDVGSYGMGLLIIGLAVLAWANDVPSTMCIAPLMPYVADTAWALTRRAAGGRPLMTAHREHVYQQIVDAGMPHVAVAGIVGFASIVCAAVAWWAGDRVFLALLGLIVVVIGYLFLPRVTQRSIGAVA